MFQDVSGMLDGEVGVECTEKDEDHEIGGVGVDKNVVQFW